MSELRIKLDENLGNRGAQMLREAGHEVATVAEEHLSGAPDGDVIAACRVEKRVLVTLDLDFSNPFVFPPQQSAGTAVLRLTGPMNADSLYGTLRTLITGLSRSAIAGKLWIVERHRVREYLPEDDE